MDIKETGKKLKPFAPVLSVALVTACVAGSLSGYEAPVYAATQEETPVKKEETKEKKEEKKTAAKGSFDLEDGVYKGTGTGYAGDITVSVLIKDKQIVSIDILSSSDDAAFFTRAKAVINKIIEGQTLDVDTVSGATFSSRGIISAVKNALTGEKDTSETGQAQSGQTGAAAGSSTSVAQVEDAAAYKDGTYYGSGTGFGGPLKVMVEISGGKIASIQIVENSDGSDYISKAASLIDSIIAKQSTNVDTVSGATYSSVGIIQAVRDALSQAAVNGTSDGTQDNNSNNSNNNGSSDDNNSTVTGTVPYKEGIYYGTAEGYSGDVSVAVVIQEKTIKAILITESSDDEAFFNRAMDVVKKVIQIQKTDDVDTVSGATYSSKGLLKAIKNALKQAEKVTNGESIDEKPDVTELEELIEKAEKLEEDAYTEASWAVLQTRLEDAKEALKETKQTAVDKAAEKLKKAIAQLESKDGKDEENTKYVSGTYEVTVPCEPDEDEDFERYNLTMSVTIRDDKIIAITDITGDGASDNDRYILKAANGTSSIKGVVSQIIEKGMPEDIDTVSRATCSSNAILEGCKKVLEKAERPTDMEAE
ncbi:MAG: FMN-binding protein [Coprococcus comes]|nr:FMN-binding protein [Coprococcus comes]